MTEPKPQNGGAPALFGDESVRVGVGATESRTITALEAMNVDGTFTPAQELLAEVARALAQNIDGGNRKGRSIGNEAMQLQSVIATLVGDDPTDDDVLDLPEETRELMSALANPAR